MSRSLAHSVVWSPGEKVTEPIAGTLRSSTPPHLRVIVATPLRR